MKSREGECVREKLAMLLELQRLDDELRDLRKASATLDALKTENAETLSFFNARLTERAAQIEETQAFCKEKRADIERAEEDLRRSRSRLSNISSQRELTALNKELDSARKAISTRNEELKRLTEQLDETEEDQEKKGVEREALFKEMRAVEARLEADLEVRRAESSRIEARKGELRGLLGGPLFSRYTRISKARGGVAVSDATGGKCAGCNIAIPPQVYIRLQRLESLESCSNCQRYLIFFRGVAGAEE